MTHNETLSPTFHPAGIVTYCQVPQQQWVHAASVPDNDLLAMPADERVRVQPHITTSPHARERGAPVGQPVIVAGDVHEYTWHLTLTRCPPDGPPVSAFYNRYPTAYEAVQVGSRLLIEEGLLPRFALVWETHRDGARIDWQVAEITTRGTLAKYFWRCQTRGTRVPPAFGAEWLAAMYPRASQGDNQGDVAGSQIKALAEQEADDRRLP